MNQRNARAQMNVTANGHCLEPVIFDGDEFLIEPRIPKLNEIATFCVRGYGDLVKVIRTDLSHLSRLARPRIVYFAALNPTFREFGIAAADIERMGTVVEIIRSRAPRSASRQPWPGLAFEGASR